MRELPNYPYCVICGTENTIGIKISYFREENKVVAKCKFTKYHSGYHGIVHGGLLASILDEALGRIVSSITSKMVVTGELNVRFHCPVAVETCVSIEATMDDEQKHPHRFFTASGKITDENGKVCVSAKGRFFIIPENKYEEILSTLKIKGSDKKVTMEDL